MRKMTLGLTIILAMMIAGCATRSPNTRAHTANEPTGSLGPSGHRQRTNAEGLRLIRESEGLSLKAYRDNGQWLIGYGDSVHAAAGKTITPEEAEAYLVEDVALCERKLQMALTKPASSNEFSAMVSLCYNVGWQPIVASTLVRRFNENDRQGAADAFLDWTKITAGGGKTVLQRLVDRRVRERSLFLAPDPSS